MLVNKELVEETDVKQNGLPGAGVQLEQCTTMNNFSMLCVACQNNADHQTTLTTLMSDKIDTWSCGSWLQMLQASACREGLCWSQTFAADQQPVMITG